MCINSRLFVPRLAESLLHWFFFCLFVCLIEFRVAVIQLLDPSFSFFCYWLCLLFTKCTWGPNIWDWLQRELSVPQTRCCRCPLDALQGYVSSEFIWSLEWCQKKWKVIFLNAPHRVQSHYRVCQIQLVTEFAAEERGQVKQAGGGCGPGGYVDKVDGNKKQGFVLIKMSFLFFFF